MKLKFWLTAFLSIFILLGCRQKKKISLSGEDPVDVTDFIASFEPRKLPFQFADTSVTKKKGDSLLISFNVFTQFVPDSFVKKFFGNELTPKIYPMGRVSTPEGENYLFAKAIAGDHKIAFVIYFDKKNNFIAGLPVLQPDANPATRQLCTIDKKFTISKITIRKNPDGSISDGKDIYALNKPARAFIMIMTDALDEKNVEMVNPIDTLPRKNKYAGEYLKNKKNLVSIRDNKKAGRISFFVYFEKNNGSCIGELKGEASFISANTAVYRSPGDPCVLEFIFTSSSVTMTEKEGCGLHRGVDCLFEGIYPKKKEVKKSKKTVKDK